MRPLSDDGTKVDAEFAVEPEGDLLSVVLESRGGASQGSEPRNSEYNIALELLLRRLAQLRAIVVDALVDSARARELPYRERRIVAEPINLDSHTDLSRVRAELGKAAAAVGRPPGASGEGNRTKRIKLLVDVPSLGQAKHSAAALVAVLARESLALDVSPTAVGGFLRELIGIPITTVSGSRINTILAVDSRDVVVSTTRTAGGHAVPIGDVVAAMELIKQNGVVDVTVDTLGYRSAFIGAVLLQLPGARILGSAPARIMIGNVTESDPSDKGISSDVDSAPFQRALDRPATTRQRREQQRLRFALLRGRDQAPCALCGETYPARFLRAAHIKKRAVAADDEARDIPRIAMLACVFGCDALFEDGYVGVENGAVIGTAMVDLQTAIGRHIGKIRGRAVDGYEDAAVYFDWHRTHVFMS
ncbi:hypothetical protein [Microbacterium sp. LMI1-1-1.1]|uniref:hypothetical protein n=1 Tax=Microbacterium sp. LMI1-1-1.1 TaxID=3135223 RepID=UPI0034677D9E